jgi:hypothetical protein
MILTRSMTDPAGASRDETGTFHLRHPAAQVRTSHARTQSADPSWLRHTRNEPPTAWSKLHGSPPRRRPPWNLLPLAVPPL